MDNSNVSSTPIYDQLLAAEPNLQIGWILLQDHLQRRFDLAASKFAPVLTSTRLVDLGIFPDRLGPNDYFLT